MYRESKAILHYMQFNTNSSRLQERIYQEENFELTSTFHSDETYSQTMLGGTHSIAAGEYKTLAILHAVQYKFIQIARTHLSRGEFWVDLHIPFRRNILPDNVRGYPQYRSWRIQNIGHTTCSSIQIHPDCKNTSIKRRILSWPPHSIQMKHTPRQCMLGGTHSIAAGCKINGALKQIISFLTSVKSVIMQVVSHQLRGIL